jgi:hypothetical protein
MKKINAKRASFFEGHANAKEFWFTSDDRAYISENGAMNWAYGLKKEGKDDSIDHLTRAEVEAWAAEQSGGAGSPIAPENDPNMFAVEVTQEILDMNPEMAAQGIKLGDTIYVPKDDTQTTQEEIKADVKEAVAKKTVAKKADAKKANKKK